VFPTAEVRWFARGPIPPPVETWFRQGAGSVDREPGRVDHYLQLAHVDSLGIKLREGRIEIKQRVDRHRLIRFHERVAGLVERYHKWSFQLSDPDTALARATAAAESWVPVRKERQLRRYRVADDGRIIALTASASPHRGCELELSRVEVAGETWWTLAFEAFGEPSTLRADLLEVAGYVFASDGSPALLARDSCGYAAWLGRMTQEEEGG
jgi:hypothetical protein